MNGRYQVAFYHPDGRLARIHSLTGTEKLAYSRRLNDVGKCLLSLPVALREPVMLEKDALAQVFRYDERAGRLASEGMYFLRYHDQVPGDTESFVVAGVSVDHLLARRIYNPADDPAVANGFSTKGGPVVSVMRAIVQEQMIAPAVNTDRAFTGLSLPDIGADESPDYFFRREIGKETVLDLLQSAAAATQTDFWVDFTRMNPAGYPEFAFHAGMRGTDQSKHTYPDGPYLYLSPQLGNLVQPQLTLDTENEKNVVYVLGKGANGNRLVYRKEREMAAAESLYNRIETVVESNEADTLDELIAAADTALAENEPSVTFTFVPLVGAGGCVYRQDWDLGDIPTVGVDGTEIDARITAVNVTLIAGQETIEVETERMTWDS